MKLSTELKRLSVEAEDAPQSDNINRARYKALQGGFLDDIDLHEYVHDIFPHGCENGHEDAPGLAATGLAFAAAIAEHNERLERKLRDVAAVPFGGSVYQTINSNKELSALWHEFYDVDIDAAFKDTDETERAINRRMFALMLAEAVRHGDID